MLSGTDVNALASAVGRRHIRKSVVVSVIVELHAITDTRVVLVGIGEDSLHRASSDIHYVVDRTTAVGETCVVANQEAKPLLLVDWCRRDAGVEAKQIGNWTGVIRTATGTNRRRIGHQWQQVEARRRGNRQAENGVEQVRQQRIEEEVWRIGNRVPESRC